MGLFGKNKVQKSLKFWQDDLLAAVSVSLIALPISLALAKASGVDPMAGIVSTIVGGIVMFFLGGSNVTITGPGYGLVLVIFNAVLTIGFESTLAAISIGGGIIFLLGVLKFGKLADFFPSASIQGMLAAIGLTLIIKQAHYMLGVESLSENGDSYLTQMIYIPQYFINFFKDLNAAGILGVISFLILVNYSRLKKGVIKYIPAPMWVVLIGIGYYSYYKWFGNISDYPLDKSQLLFIDLKELHGFIVPEFTQLNAWPFWEVVISIVLVGLIESLLSIKAIDKLDPLKRRSNFNKDLRALGVSSVLASFLGGIPVVTVISRSSVNVDQGAKTRLSGLFNSLIIIGLIAFCVPVLNLVPLSILAAILVYTGYKLSSPKIWVKVFQIGWEQFGNFLLTLICTLLFGLVFGILIGIVATILVQLILNHNRHEFIKYLVQPNVISYTDHFQKHVVGVKGVSNFLNFLRLKNALDQISRKNHVILDFSLARYIDHTVMENIRYYEQEFKSKGGDFEVIGLDVHHSESAHPLASRRMLKIARIVNKTTNLTRRQQDLKEYAKSLNWKFAPKSVFELPELSKCKFFDTKELDHAFNVIRGFENGIRYEQFDVEYTKGELYVQEKLRSSMLLIKLEKEIPSFKLDKETLIDKVIKLTGKDDINFTEHEEFSNMFHLEGNDEDLIHEFFTDQLIEFIEKNPGYHVETVSNLILIVKKERLGSLTEIQDMLTYGRGLAQIIQHNY